jgi:uncharacterized damage-inducible protein DinB
MRKLLCWLALAVIPATMAQAATSIRESLDFWVGNAEKEIVAAAEAMPETKYGFAPKGAEFAGVRMFGQQIKHLAANNYRMAARTLGQAVPADQESETGPDSVRSKAEIMEYLRGSFAALHRATASITPENAEEAVVITRAGKSTEYTRVWFVVDAVAHSYDHYGQMVEYLRMNGIVPPASR